MVAVGKLSIRAHDGRGFPASGYHPLGERDQMEEPFPCRGGGVFFVHGLWAATSKYTVVRHWNGRRVENVKLEGIS